MALGPVTRAALLVALPGIAAFVLGILAENKKPSDGDIHTTTVGNWTTCHYPNSMSVWLGSFSVVLLFVSTCIALVSLFYPYEKKRLPHNVLAKNTTFLVFFIISLAIYLTAEGLLMWATIGQSMHEKQNRHYGLKGACPAVKTGLFGGAAFLALDSMLFWLICLMLLVNAREDHFEEDAAANKGAYEEIPPNKV